MGSHLPQRRHQLHARPPRSGLVRFLRENLQTQTPVQSQLRLLPHPDHGRRPKHDPPIPHPNRLQIRRRQKEFRPHVSLPSKPPFPSPPEPTRPTTNHPGPALKPPPPIQMPHVLHATRRRHPRRQTEMDRPEREERPNRG